MRRRRLLLVSLCCAGVAAPAAHARPFTIVAKSSSTGFGEVRAIGAFKPERAPELRAAIAAYGQPTRRSRRFGGVACRVLWAPIGIRFSFVNLGGGGSACQPALGKSQTARAFDTRWRTARGLSVGDRLRRLRRLYPGASRHGRSWWLVRAISLYGPGRRPYPVLRATMRNGRVSSFALTIGAAGE